MIPDVSYIGQPVGAAVACQGYFMDGRPQPKV